MSEKFLAHKVIGFDGGLNVISVDAYSNPHDQMLRSFNDFAVNLEQIASFKCFKSKKVIVKVPAEIDSFIESFIVSLNDIVDSFLEKRCRSIASIFAVVELVGDVLDRVLGLFAQIIDGDSGGQNAIMRMDHILNQSLITM